MPDVLEILRARRRRHVQAQSRQRLKAATRVAAVIAVTLLSGLAVFASSIVGQLTRDLPDAGNIEGMFGLRGAESFRPVVVYDRSGQVPLFQISHPLAADRRWLSLNDGRYDSIPEDLANATIAILDPTFWTNPGYDLEALRTVLFEAGADQAPSQRLTLTQRLVNAALLPPSGPEVSEGVAAIRSALLAAELTSRQSKEQILTWYLNSAYYGMWTYGVDAASLVYFGKHATELDLAESALIAGLPMDPLANPIERPAAAKALQAQVLQAMVERGFISRSEERRAKRQAISVMDEAAVAGWDRPDYAEYLFQDLSQALGDAAIHRSGMRVISTLDYDLMLQTACAAQSQVQRLAGDPPGSVVPAADGTPCLAAGLLSPVRPGDAGVDHNVDEWSLVVLDPTTAELLALHGGFDRSRTSGPLLVPFIYLASLAKGNSPATMVLDIPAAPIADLGIHLPSPLEAYQGPVSLRSALANLYPGAAMRTLESVGLEDVRRTAEHMGIDLRAQADGPAAAGEAAWQASLLDLATAYGIVANGGTMVGRAESVDSAGRAEQDLVPALVLRVEDADRRVLYRYQPAQKQVLSAQLAFLMADVLSDESARWPSLGRSNLLEINRPAGAAQGSAGEGQGHWTVGFTPLRVVGVWMGAAGHESLVSIGAHNGSSSIWNSVMRYAVADLPPEGWQVPPGVGEMQVCEPSGLLPTQYCPQLVQEYFVHGTEPTDYDGLFQPFRINKETGKLATLFTPLDQVEERIYLILPPEAQEWAQEAGLEQPPDEYDAVLGLTPEDPHVQITSPEPFAEVRGQVAIRGAAAAEGFRYYRLQYGEGLNPARWVQIDEDHPRRVASGILGRWTTDGLNGLYTLQLMVVLEDGQVRTASSPVTIDNQPPEVRLLSPEAGEQLQLGLGDVISLQAEAFDSIAIERVEFYIGGRRVAVLHTEPYTVNWSPGNRSGEITLSVRAYDRAGNWSESESILVELRR